MRFTYIRRLFALILSLLGIAAVFIAPSTSDVLSDEKSRPKKCNDNKNPKIVVQDPDNNIVHADVHHVNDPIKYYGDSTVLDIFNNLKTEVMNLLDSTAVRMFIPDAESSNTTTIYEDAESEFVPKNPQPAATEPSKEPINFVPDTTIYNSLPNENINTSCSQKKRVTKKIRKILSGLTGRSEVHNPKAESTAVIDSNRSENDRSGVILSIKNPTTPVRRVFSKWTNLLRIKNNSTKDTEHTSRRAQWCDLHDGDCNNNNITLYF
ncbi:uncharacterized protein LOC100680515 isoform X2 [Nasonia vitripennis]|uniref:Uncharacterized protein n=1 Tax=Nasonia vitripennis TaxID=7425 RepID=A0A7M7IP15_NASVI|nr:uncharacterized protein LOC100680515 isoform X2 [Nasonia vitripennis]